MSVWPLIFTGEEICVATYSPDQNPVHLATSLTHQRRNLSVWLCNNLPEEKYTLSVCLATFSPVSFWPLSHQCLFGHFLTGVWSLTHQSLFGHLLTSVFGHFLTSVRSLTHQSLFGYLLTSVFGHLPVCVWPLTHQRRKGAVLWDVEHTLIHTQCLVEVLSVVY